MPVLKAILVCGVLIAQLCLTLAHAECFWRVSGTAHALNIETGLYEPVDFTQPNSEFGITSRWEGPDCHAPSPQTCPNNYLRWNGGQSALLDDEGNFLITSNRFTSALECSKNRALTVRLQLFDGTDGWLSTSRFRNYGSFTIRNPGPSLTAAQTQPTHIHTVMLGALCFEPDGAQLCPRRPDLSTPTETDPPPEEDEPPGSDTVVLPLPNACNKASAQIDNRYNLKHIADYAPESTVSDDQYFRFLRREDHPERPGYVRYVFRGWVLFEDVDGDGIEPHPWLPEGEEACPILFQTETQYPLPADPIAFPYRDIERPTFWWADEDERLSELEQGWFRVIAPDSYAGTLKFRTRLDAGDNLAESDEIDNRQGPYCFQTESLTFQPCKQ